MTEQYRQRVNKFIQNTQDPDYVRFHIKSLYTYNLEETYKKGQGLTGLENLQNTCYLNSILQCLRHTGELNEVLSKHEVPNIISANFVNERIERAPLLVLVCYIKLMHLMWGHNNAHLSPTGFRILLAQNYEQFANCDQHDAHELLMALLQTFHDTLIQDVHYTIQGQVLTDIDLQIQKAHQDWVAYYKGHDSRILDLFGCQLRTELACLHCHQITYRFDPMMVIDLAIPTATGATLTQCLDQFVSPEQLGENDLYLCEKCNTRTSAHKRHTLWKLPQILVIKLNRFQHQMVNGQYRPFKIGTRIEYPINDLKLEPYLSSPIATKFTYDLYAVTCHIGSLQGGHYYAICYNPLTKEWMRYNDTHVDPIHNPQDLVTNNAYILYYHGVKTE